MDRELRARIQQLVREEIIIVDYDPRWPGLFREEAAFLRQALPSDAIGRIEHIGSTAVPGLAAKAIIDVLVELCEPRTLDTHIVPVLTAAGYEYFWRTDVKPPYAWFIKRRADGERSYHIHMVEPASGLWERLLFRDYLREFPALADSYGELKARLAEQYPTDRIAYAEAKSHFIARVTEQARQYFSR